MSRTFAVVMIATVALVTATAGPALASGGLGDARAEAAARAAVAPEPVLGVQCYRARKARGVPQKRRALCLVSQPRPEGGYCHTLVEVKRGSGGAIRTRVIRLGVCVPPVEAQI